MPAAPDRLAVLSDVHGNLTAYQAVLADIEARGITRIVNLGDTVGKGPRGAACVQLTRERCELAVQGNWEAFLTSGEPVSELAEWARSELQRDQLAWLAALPLSHDLRLGSRQVRLYHASAASVFTRIFGDCTDEQFAAMFDHTPLTGDGPRPDTVVYGDIHATYLRVQQGLTLVNVGSVGNPLDAWTAPYVVLDGADGVSGIQFVRVEYDIEAEIAVAEASRMPEQREYAVELRTGVYRGCQPARA